MSEIKFSRVISVSSEDSKHPGTNLLKSDVSGCWRCKDPGEKQAVIILQLEKLCQIHSITIGNDNSAFVEFLVGRSAAPDTYEVLRVASSLMSVQDAKNDRNKNIVRFFKLEEFSQSVVDQSWDILKIICSQPFNKHVQYGLSFVKVHGKSNIEGNLDSLKKQTSQTLLGKFVLKKEEKEDEQPQIGSFFARRNDINASVSSAVAIRAASNDISDRQNSSSSKRLSAALQELKDSKRKRKRDEESDVAPSTDGRRSTVGPLLYVDSVSENEPSQSSQKKAETRVNEPSTTKRKNSPRKLVRKANAKDGKDTQNTVNNDASSDVTRKPFDRLMEGVIFVISGYQNPLRAEIRSKALQMGAKYKVDWDSTCSHLICAYSNTPKSNQVRGRGWIVSKDWIEDCYKQRKRLKCAAPRCQLCQKSNKIICTITDILRDVVGVAIKGEESHGSGVDRTTSAGWVIMRSYRLDKNDTFSNQNDEEIWEEKPGEKISPVSTCPDRKTEKVAQKRISTVKTKEISGSSKDTTTFQSVYDVDTDVDSDDEKSDKFSESITLTILPDFFDRKSFYLGSDLVSPTIKMLGRYITAFKGTVSDDIDDVNFIISENSGYKENITNTPVVLPDWIWECNDRKTFVPAEHYTLE